MKRELFEIIKKGGGNSYFYVLATNIMNTIK